MLCRQVFLLLGIRLVCRGCDVVLESNQRNHCALCGVYISQKNMIEIANKGRIASRSAEANAKQSAAQKQTLTAVQLVLTECSRRIQPN